MNSLCSLYKHKILWARQIWKLVQLRPSEIKLATFPTFHPFRVQILSQEIGPDYQNSYENRDLINQNSYELVSD
jgi:hypothetical protein